MAFVATIAPRAATGETREAYRCMQHVAGSGTIANVIRVFSLRPASMRRAIRAFELAMWAGDEARPPREFLGAAISRLNDCHY